MSSRQHRMDEVMNLIRAYKDDNDADEIIRMKTGYSKALISALRSDMESTYHGKSLRRGDAMSIATEETYDRSYFRA